MSDGFWLRLAPVLVISTPRKKSGRSMRDVHSIFSGPIWLARTGSQWSQLPRRYGPKSTVHERFCAWGEHERLRAAWALVLEEDDQALGTDWEWGKPTTGAWSKPRGKKGGAGVPEATGSNPTDRGKARSKRTLLTDAKGIPLSAVPSGANRHDGKMPAYRGPRRFLLYVGRNRDICCSAVGRARLSPG
ncbi:transposase [Deinococcus hopiensis]|uniref:transposase n=1 Tax=Deinococcus hopiensis TaxID=309885 RepID=UPI0009FD5029|nr:transposase [Deinococcus hopiensis]